ncbi:MAG: sugar phosphate isomerase/epimerase family protein [Spirochaetia bacterium]
MKISCSSQSLDRQFMNKKMDLPGFIRYAAQTLKIPCVEFEDKHFANTTPHYIASIKAELERNRLAVANIAFFCSFGYPTKVQNDAELARAVEWMEVARSIGSPNFRIFAGWMGGQDPEIGRKGPPVAKPAAAWDTMIGYVTTACDRAREYGLNVVIENHNHGGFLSYSREVVRLFAEVNRDNLTLLLDTGNYVDGLEGIQKTVHLVKHHVHLKAGVTQEDGRDSAYDFDATLAILKKSGFNGSLSIEYEGTQDEYVCLPRIVTYLRSTIGG